MNDLKCILINMQCCQWYNLQELSVNAGCADVVASFEFSVSVDCLGESYLADII